MLCSHSVQETQDLALVAHLAAQGRSVRVVSLRPPATVPTGVDSRVGDVTDGDAAIAAAEGAAVVYQCLNAPYTEWPERFPPLQRAVMAAAERSGKELSSSASLSKAIISFCRTRLRKWSLTALIKILVIQALRFVPVLKLAKERKARKYVSCTMSSASWLLPRRQ